MRIFIDARMSHVGGTLTVATNLLNALLSKYGNQHEFFVYHSKGQELPKYNNATLIYTISSKPSTWLLEDSFRLPKKMAQTRADIFHSFKRPQIGAVRGPKIITIHSAYPFLFPEFQGRGERVYWTPLMKKAAKNVDALVVVSETDKNNIMEALDVDGSKINVIPNAVDSSFFLIKDEDVIRKTKLKYGLPDHFILFVGNSYKPKNIPNLIAAFDIAIEKYDLPHSLVLVGGKGADELNVIQAIGKMKRPDRVIRTGIITTDLPKVYNAADLFVFPTLYDSFGLPVLEAMACGIPTIVSINGALPEVAKKASVFVDPEDIEAISNSIGETLNSDDALEILRKKGLSRVKKFSWDTSADLTIKLYQDVLSDR